MFNIHMYFPAWFDLQPARRFTANTRALATKDIYNTADS